MALTLASDRTAVVRGQDEVRFVTLTLHPQAASTTEVRRPVHLAVVLDASGSMSSEGKMIQARRAARSLAHALGPDDRFSLVTFANGAQTVMPPTPGHALGDVDRILDAVAEGGGTNLYAGLDRGIMELGTVRDTGASTRVIVLSDGQANEGITAPHAIARLASSAQASGIGVSAVGLGLDYNEDLLAHIADAGGGSYAFVDQASDLQGVFAAELQRTAQVVAQQATVDLIFAPGVEPLELVGWEGGRIDGGWRVPVGDLYAGEARKIVARVRVRAGEGTSMPLATASASWTTAADGLHDSVQAAATLSITADTRVAEASADRDTTRASLNAWSHDFLDRSTRAYAKGDTEAAQAILQEGTANLKKLEDLGYDDDTTAKDLATFERQAATYSVAAPSSAEGKRAIKAGKEQARANAKK